MLDARSECRCDGMPNDMSECCDDAAPNDVCDRAMLSEVRMLE